MGPGVSLASPMRRAAALQWGQPWFNPGFVPDGAGIGTTQECEFVWGLYPFSASADQDSGVVRPLSSGWMPAPRARELHFIMQKFSGAEFDELVRAEADGDATWAVRDPSTRQISVRLDHLDSI